MTDGHLFNNISLGGHGSTKPMKKELKWGSSSKKMPQKKKKDLKKKAMTGYLFFSQTEIKNVKKGNPGIAFGDITRIIGDKWKNMTAEKEPYEVLARADKKRYKEELGGYKNPQLMNIDFDSS